MVISVILIFSVILNEVKNLSRPLLPLLLAPLLAVCCQQPRSAEQFIPAPGPYVFRVDLSDTLAAYDLSFYTRLDGYPQELQAAQELALNITWTSPSDSSYAERVYLPLTGRSTLYSRQVLQPYRAGVRPVEPGLWTLTVSVPYAGGRETLRGLGLVVAQSADRQSLLE